MKKQWLIVLQCFFLASSFGQPRELLIKRGAGGSFIEHNAAPKEGLFPLGRMYNVHPRHIAAFNKLDFNKGLSIGQLIRIPLTDTNFNQADNKGLPVYYKTTVKESLANISIKNNKVTLKNLRGWNNLTDDNIPAGTKLIVGFLLINETRETDTAIVEKKNEINISPVVEKGEKEEKKREVGINKEEPKKTEAELKKEEPIIIKEEPKKITPSVKAIEENSSEAESGFFRLAFAEQVKQSPVSKELMLTSAVFISANGWQDAKYYLLMNGVEPGTIIKISNPANNKAVYAKVLYGVEGIRQNQGLDMRISDAAAAALAITETDKFIVKVNY